MAIDFGGALIGDNYSTGVLAKLNATDIANAVWLDSAYTSYTGTITTGAKRITTGGVIEQYNGSAWVALSVGYVLKAGDTMTGSLTVPRVLWTGDAAGAAGVVATDSSFNRISSAAIAYGISTNAAGGLDIMANQASQAIRFYAGTANNASPPMVATISSTGLSVSAFLATFTLSATGASNPLMYLTTTRAFGANRNWQIGVDEYAEGHWTLTPSTAQGGSSYTTPLIDVSSTGLAVTGTLSSTGILSVLRTGATATTAILTTGVSDPSFRLEAVNGAAGGVAGVEQARFGVTYAGAFDTGLQFLRGSGTQNGTLNLMAGAAVVASASSAGLAVTGTLSATGTLSTTGLIGGRSSNGQAFTTTNGVDADFSITLASGDVQLINTVGSSKISTVINGTARTQVSSTGLAVTGALSATGGFIAQSLTATSTIAAYGASGGAAYSYSGAGVAVLRAYSNGSGTGVGQLDINLAGSVVSSFASTGLAVTGTLSATKRAYTSATAVSFSATPTFDASTTNIIVFGNLTANVTSMTMSNAQEGQFLSIRFRQDATGSRTVALPSGAKVSGAITATANLTSYLNITYNATDSRWEGNWSNIPA